MSPVAGYEEGPAASATSQTLYEVGPAASAVSDLLPDTPPPPGESQFGVTETLTVSETATVTKPAPGPGPTPTPTLTDWESLKLDGLELNDAVGYGIQEWNPPFTPFREEWAGGADSEGSVLVRNPLPDNATTTVTLEVRGATRDDVHAKVRAVIRKLQDAKQTPGGVPLEWNPSGSNQALTFYVLSGQVAEYTVNHLLTVGLMAIVPVNLSCEPYGYGPEVTGNAVTVTGPVASLVVPSIAGDAPARARLVVTDLSGRSRRHVEFGVESRYFNTTSQTPLLLDSDTLVTSGFAGSQQTLTGAYDSPPSAPNLIRHALTGAHPVALCGTGNQAHVGRYRVKARVHCDADIYVRLSWQVGDGGFTSNDWVKPPVYGDFAEVNLGEILIPQVTAGAQRWTGRVDVLRAGANGNAGVDYLLMLPAEEGYGRARVIARTDPGITVAYDDFGVGSTGPITGRAMGAGGAWGQAGHPTGLSINALGQAQRSVDDGFQGHFALAGTTSNYVNVQVGVRIAATAPLAQTGVFARYLDPNNHIMVISDRNQGTSLVLVRVRLNGTLSTLGSFTINGASRVDLAVYSTGQWSAGADGGLLLSGQHAALATGGTLAQGRVGIYDAAGTTGARAYDEFTVTQIATPPVVIHPSRTLELTGDGAQRQSSDGLSYSGVHLVGSNFRLYPNRPNRVAVAVNDQDVETGPSTNVATSSVRLQPFWRCAYLSVPPSS